MTNSERKERVEALTQKLNAVLDLWISDIEQAKAEGSSQEHIDFLITSYEALAGKKYEGGVK